MNKNSDVFIKATAIIFEQASNQFPAPAQLDTDTLREKIRIFDDEEHRSLRSELTVLESTVSHDAKRASCQHIIDTYVPMLEDDENSQTIPQDQRSQMEELISIARKSLEEGTNEPDKLLELRAEVSKMKVEKDRIDLNIKSTLSFLTAEDYLRNLKEDYEEFSNRYQLTSKGLQILGYEITKGGELKSDSAITRLKSAITKGSKVLAQEVITGMLFPF